PALGSELLELTRWMADYYACAWGETLAAVLPAAMKRESKRRQVNFVRPAEGVGRAELDELEKRFEKQHILLRTLLEASGELELRDVLRRLRLSEAPAKTLAKKGLIVLEKRDARPEFDVQAIQRTTAREPSPEQAVAIETIAGRVLAREYGTFLLKGVTGSGKTEVYLQVIERALAEGRGAIILVPEIALTPQTVGRFAERFGEVAVMHSRMTDAQRMETWMRVRRGEARVVVGARSAVFAPVEDLGVIVVDEEHEPSFKQSSTPRYHGRDVAVMRAMKSGAVCVLGSATPALETLHNARAGRYELVSLSKRIGDRTLPEVKIVDMRKEQAEAKSRVLFSRALVSALGETLAQKEQAILFLNRRGYSPVLWCQACGETMHCEQCDVALTYHRHIHRVVCHSCAAEQPPPEECPTCTAPAVRQLGAGSERVEDVLAKLFPTARVKRMDSDTMLRREDYVETLSSFGKGEIDVLVGTQMIAKGLDFPGVTLVGVISADSTLHIPDYRAAERTFQLLAQVSGRAGRGDKPGRIFVQTTTPEHPVILRARTHDYDGFAKDEFEMRRDLGYPPFGRLIRCVFDDSDKARVEEGAHRCADLLRAKLEDEEFLRVLGPAEAPISMLRGKHRRHLLVKAGTSGEALARARWLLHLWSENNPRPRMTLDVDPVEML
ncbi:MAG: primosomal protein N', partial [Planctomycetota bacterium]